MRKDITKVTYKGKLVREQEIQLADTLDELIGGTWSEEYVLRCFNYGHRVAVMDSIRREAMPKKLSVVKVMAEAYRKDPERVKKLLLEAGVDISALNL